jgi:hypothetical protein
MSIIKNILNGMLPRKWVEEKYNLCLLESKVQEGIYYYYIQDDGSLVNIGKCISKVSKESSCWHDGNSWSLTITFQKEKTQYVMFFGGYSYRDDKLRLIVSKDHDLFLNYNKEMLWKRRKNFAMFFSMLKVPSGKETSAEKVFGINELNQVIGSFL